MVPLVAGFFAIAFIIYVFMSCTGQITQQATGSIPLDTVEASEHYYRSYLGDDGKEAYDAIEQGVRSFDYEIQLDKAFSVEDLDSLIGYVLNDSPDLVWFSGVYTPSDEHNGTYSSIIPSYLMGYSQAERTLRLQLALSDEVPTSDDDVVQMTSIMDFLAENISHDHSGRDDQTIVSLVNDRTAVCAGYAKDAVLLARSHGIPAIYIRGKQGNENHAWIAAKVNGQILYYDPFNYDGDPGTDSRECAVALDAFSLFHKADEPSKLPAS